MYYIYYIKSTCSDKVYVGQTNNLVRRWYDHRTQLIRGVHYNPALQAACKKYGLHTFEYIFAFAVDTHEEVLELEMSEIAYWKSLDLSYNHSPGGVGGVPGVKRSEQASVKIVNALKGRPVSNETREKIRLALLGKKHSEETKAKISMKMSRPRSEKWKEVRRKLFESKDKHCSNCGRDAPSLIKNRCLTCYRYHLKHGEDRLLKGE